ncbi:MAG: virulence factor family protein [Sphingomonadales bacterium]|nr:virulence factor family protein [Sphingomonadales bacterium]
MRQITTAAMAGLLLFSLAADTGAATAVPEPAVSSYSFAPFGAVHVTQPGGAPRGVVIFLSDSRGAPANDDAITRELARRGLLVAAVSAGALLRTPEAWAGRCLNANYPIVALSNDLQHRMGVRAYMQPIIIGVGEGGALAYATLSQWANGSYRGVVSVDAPGEISSSKPWCTAPGFSAERVNDAGAWRFGPNKQVRLPLIVMRTATQQTASSALVPAVPGARAELLPSATAQWPTVVADAAISLLAKAGPDHRPATTAVPDMPLTLVPAAKTNANHDLMAIVYSGDGGWVGIDRDVAGQLAAAGIPVVGVDSLSYFWSARTPAGAARDLSQLIEAFSRHWGRPRVLLVGYSFGANVIPHMVDQLRAAARAKIERVSLLGLGSTADFQFHLTSWLNLSSDNSLPTIPAITRLRGMALQCVRGEQEEDSACEQIPAGLAQEYLVPGGHHFDRNAGLLAEIILGHRHPGTVSQ